MGQHRKFTTFALLEEATPGTTPASAMQLISCGGMPAFKRERSTGAPDFVTSGSLTPYPQEIFTDEGSLSIPATPLVYRNMVQCHEGIYANDEASVSVVTGTDISVTSDVLNSVATAFGSLAVGDCVYITFANAGDGTSGVYGPILAATSADLTFPGGQLADFSAGNSVTIKAFTRLTEGEVFKSFSAEWVATALTTYFEGGAYFVPNSHEFSWSAGGGFATETCSFRGKKPTKAAATIGTGAATAAPTSAAMNSANRFGTLWLGEAATSIIAGATVADLTFSVARDNGFQPGLGSTDFEIACLGDLTTSLKATVVLDDTTAAIVDEYEDLDTLWARWDMVDAQGNRLIWFQSAMKPVNRDKGDSNNVLTHSLDLVGHDPTKSSGDTHNITGMPMTGLFYVAA